MIELARTPGRQRTGTGQPMAGAAVVDLTPPPGLAMAGFSMEGAIASGARDPLCARAVVLEDGRGEAVALCVVDLMTASRYLLERSASLAAARCGLGVDRLVLCATHTHFAPGNVHGNRLYDTFAQARRGFDRDLADWLADGIARAVCEASEGLQPALLGLGRSTLFGVAKNASMPAFERNPEAATWGDPGWPGHGAPEELGPAWRAVDGRVTALAAVRTGGGALIASWASFGTHCTALGIGEGLYAADWAGTAVQVAEAAHPGAVVAMSISAGADTNVLPEDLAPGPALRDRVGHAVGEAVAEATRRAIDAAVPFDVDVRYGELDLPGPGRSPAAGAQRMGPASPTTGASACRPSAATRTAAPLCTPWASFETVSSPATSTRHTPSTRRTPPCSVCRACSARRCASGQSRPCPCTSFDSAPTASRRSLVSPRRRWATASSAASSSSTASRRRASWATPAPTSATSPPPRSTAPSTTRAARCSTVATPPGSSPTVSSTSRDLRLRPPPTGTVRFDTGGLLDHFARARRES